MKKLKFLFPAALICLLCFAAQAQQQRGRVVCVEGAGDNKTTFKIWLEKHALYIITPEEKKAALALKTEAEQYQFVEDFWLRRDPDPKTEINEFKEEYYNRIAYTNEHFSSKAVAGWRTDKGRVYILYGAPDFITRRFDEIETKSWIEEWHYRGTGVLINDPTDKGETKSQLVEWHYRSASTAGNEYKFVFADLKSDGNFRLVSHKKLFFQ